MDLCAYWFFFCIFVNMMIFHIKIKYIKIDPQSYIPLNLYLKNQVTTWYNSPSKDLS